MSDTKRLEFIGDQIKEARAKRGLRLHEVGRLLGGVPVPTVHAWEAGQNPIPVLRLVELADIIKLDLHRLVRSRAIRPRRRAPKAARTVRAA